jgi:hypothetical protein
MCRQVEALEALQRCLRRAHTSATAAADAAAQGGEPAAAAVAAAARGAASAAQSVWELAEGVAFVEVVAARILAQPEWGLSRGLLLQLGCCQMRRMAVLLSGDGDVRGAAEMEAQAQARRLRGARALRAETAGQAAAQPVAWRKGLCRQTWQTSQNSCVSC